ncbi:enoyl-CoA hydratase family protein [Flexivirga meconopsidis]|uniref:enoyl-CoA hydratase family protein n=1 Tax=Flexivirga meconopsidis TaxID=2977121 RepID=UPI00223FA2F5|nr:enoyl-CoA hydratase family protein [Flexivirga meconopsidis]
MTTELVHLQVGDGVATITLDSPHNRNALSSQLVTELVAAFGQADADESVRAIVLAAAGPVFCSGADLSEASAGGMTTGARGLIDLQRMILAADTPVVVRLQGPVRAGGLGIVGAADIVISADTVTFAFTEARLGLAPAAISLTTLPRLTSRAAARTFLTAETFDAAAAEQMGLISQAVPAEQLDATVTTVTGDLLKGSPQGLRESKKLVNAPLIAGIDERGDALAELSASLFNSDEAREAMLAFLNRKKK